MEHSDTDLVVLAQQGDSRALATLYERHFDAIFDFLARTLRNQQDAEDAAQETLLRAANALPSLREPGRFRAWLFTIAYNTAQTTLRGRRRDPVPVPVDEEGNDAFDVMDSNRLADPAEAAVASSTAALVWEVAAGLESRQYAILDLHLRQGLESPEIADVLGITRNNAAVQLNRLKGAFRQAAEGLMLFRLGPRECPDLARRLAGASEAFSPQSRDIVERHARGCVVCKARQSRFDPETLFGALAVVSAGTFKASLIAQAAATITGGAAVVAGATAAGGASGGAAGGTGGGVIAGNGIVIGGGVATVAAGAIIAALVVLRGGDPPPAIPEPTAVPPPVATSTLPPTSTPSPTFTATPTPVPTATATPTPPPPRRIDLGPLGGVAAIEAINIQPDPLLLGIPDDWRDIGWYSQYGVPGRDGTALFYAYSEFQGQPGPFSDLDRFAVGQELMLVWDSQPLVYRVLSNVHYPEGAIPTGELVLAAGRPAGKQWVTLITSSGLLRNGVYVEHDVVIAERIN